MAKINFLRGDKNEMLKYFDRAKEVLGSDITLSADQKKSIETKISDDIKSYSSLI